MSLMINETNIPSGSDVKCNGVALDSVYCNGVKVWERRPDPVSIPAGACTLSMIDTYITTTGSAFETGVDKCNNHPTIPVLKVDVWYRYTPDGWRKQTILTPKSPFTQITATFNVHTWGVISSDDTYCMIQGIKRSDGNYTITGSSISLEVFAKPPEDESINFWHTDAFIHLLEFTLS